VLDGVGSKLKFKVVIVCAGNFNKTVSTILAIGFTIVVFYGYSLHIL
jgi:hypothetical protein